MTALVPARTALLIALIAAAALGAALYFQYALGYQPCALCMRERIPYYLGIPLAAALAIGGPRLPRGVMLGGLVLLALMFAANAVLGLYHAGIEWKFWEGPASCSAGAAAASSGNLLGDLQKVRIVPCDSAPWDFLGLSFAGWSMVISAAIAVLATASVRRA
jgi:disulfide bond formation protein DsbB